MAFDRLKDRINEFAGRSLADEEAVDELVQDVQRSLLQADADVELVQELSDRIREKALKKDIPSGMTRKEHVLNIVYQELAAFLGGEEASPDLQPQRVLLVGLFGAGKTTSAMKLANFYRKRGMTPGLIAADVDRPAAVEQLRQNAEAVDAAFYGDDDADDAAAVVQRGVDRLDGCDVLIVDSAGRDALDEELVDELQAIDAALQPDATYLVVPADIGQSAGEQAERFDAAVGIDGLVVTKLDASAKGGGALSSAAATGAEVAFIGTGERQDDLEVFDPEDYVGRLLGQPDIGVIVEKAEEAVDEDAAEAMMEGEFTMEDFFDQMDQMMGTGALDQMMDRLPFGDQLPDDALEVTERQMEEYRAIMRSMTEEERQDPSIVGRSRADRIAAGAGVERSDVRQMIKQYRQAKNMMEKFSQGGRGGMEKMLQQFGL
ncbi:MAG: signal recognition particle receptor subunit alpha [Candidatus Nanohaloarchaea archaeon]|nr:signal recognition particle receptor subunit alpha [Candidatus Nanohaloarchaea archaeon]